MILSISAKAAGGHKGGPSTSPTKRRVRVTYMQKEPGLGPCGPRDNDI